MTTFDEASFTTMPAAARTILTHEKNGVIDVVEPQTHFAEIVQRYPRPVRWEAGVAFFKLADVLEATRNPAIISNDPHTMKPMGMGSEEPLIPLNIDGPEHRSFRKLLDPLFAPRAIAHLEPQIEGLANDLIDGFIGDGKVEFHDRFAIPLPGITFLSMFGLPIEDLHFLESCKDGCIKTGASEITEMHRLAVISGNRLRDYLTAELDRREARGGSRDADLLDRLMTFEVDGHKLTRDQLLNVMHLFMIAGLDTVTASLTCIIGWLARHPDEQQALIADPSRVPAAIEELMRIENPELSGGMRYAVRDTEIAGVPIKRGDKIDVCWTTANLDPDGFPDPLTVDLNRPANRHIAFASGLHRCLGSHLARLELRTAIATFHRRIGRYEITPGETPVYSHEGVRAATYLPLSFTGR
ncbi:MAG: cytochrome P450 [Acidimicrobiia bacterium]